MCRWAWFFLAMACGAPAPAVSGAPKADLVLRGARVYSLGWGEPDREGKPAADAPHDVNGWHPDAEAVAIRGGTIAFVGSDAGVQEHIGAETRVIDLAGATVLPGFIDSHAHVASYGSTLGRVNLLGARDEREAVTRLVAAAKDVPKGEWIVGWGFDEGAWATHMPDHQLLSERLPDHPVHVRGLHGFASWNNALSLQRAGVTGKTPAPAGGRIALDGEGRPTGVLYDRATDLYQSVLPKPTLEADVESARRGLQAMADLGYVGAHDAGVDRQILRAYEVLEERQQLPIRAFVMLNLTDEELVREWIARGPRPTRDGMLEVRSVKAYYDASLGARGARLLADYSDRPGHRGVSGSSYGFDRELAREVMRAGFQLAVHAIGDAGNRETLDFFRWAYEAVPAARAHRHRIEHAQIVDPQDQPRFAELEVIASMEPPHAVEDMAWAEDRLGPERAAHGYAWRSLRRQGARVIFNSDLTGSDPNLFYGLHAAITRRDKQHQPPGGWFPKEALAPEEAIRAYTSWNAFAGFQDQRAGVLAPGRFADLTIMDLDPFVVGSRDPGKLLGGTVLMTVVGGRVVYEHGKTVPIPALYTNPLGRI